MGRFGKFFACTGYPECKYTAQIDKTTGKLATQYTPKSQIEEKIFREVHNILHYVNNIIHLIYNSLILKDYIVYYNQ